MHFDVGYSGPPLPGDQRVLEQLKDGLRSVLPSWQAFAILTNVGFILDSSSLDITGFGT